MAKKYNMKKMMERNTKELKSIEDKMRNWEFDSDQEVVDVCYEIKEEIANIIKKKIEQNKKLLKTL